MRRENIQYKTLEQMYNSDYASDDLKEINKFLFNILKKNGLCPAKLEIPATHGKLPTKKADRIDWALQCLKDIYVLKYIYQKEMNPIEQAAIEEFVHGNGISSSKQFIAKYGKMPDTNFSGGYYSTPKPDYSFPHVRLFISSRQMPPDIKELLKPFVKKPKEARSKTLDELPETVELYKGRDNAHEVELIRHLTAQAATYDLQAVLRLTDQGKAGASSKTNHPTKSGAKNILKALSNGDFYPEDIQAYDDYEDVVIGNTGIRPFAWTLLLQAGGLAKTNGNKLELTRNGKAALNKPAHEILKHLWDKWITYKHFHELSRVNIIKGQKSKKHPLYKAMDGRSGLEDALYELTPDKWIKTDDFFTFIHSKGLGFTIVRNAWAIYIGDIQYGSMGYSSWNHTDGRFARAFLLEYAATLGLIDVALIPPWGSTNDHEELWSMDYLSCLSRYDGLYAFRLNSLGAWILGLTDEYVPYNKEGSALSISENMEIKAPDDLSSADRLFLDSFAMSKSENIWELGLDRLILAIEEGAELREIGEFLASRNKEALPGPVEDLLEDANQRVSMFENKGDAVILYCKDKALVSFIANHTGFKKICMTAGKNHIVYYKNAEEQFKKQLLTIGYGVR